MTWTLFASTCEIRLTSMDQTDHRRHLVWEQTLALRSLGESGQQASAIEQRLWEGLRRWNKTDMRSTAKEHGFYIGGTLTIRGEMSFCGRLLPLEVGFIARRRVAQHSDIRQAHRIPESHR